MEKESERMKIVADENIPYVKEAFGHIGEVRTMSGRSLSSEALRDADVLLVRSITKVNEMLLEGSSVRFVGTATIGVDHIDMEYLEEHTIEFSSAQGSNANSVAEYIVAALLELSDRYHFALSGKTLGVIGAGNIGSIVARYATALGLKVLENDPPLARETGDPRYLPLDALFDADILTLHVPLNREGEDRTYHLTDREFFSKMKPGGIFINTSRGQVVETEALKGALKHEHLGAAVIDVWEHEPTIDTALLEKVAIATPHIAGYSRDGKANGTQMMYDAVCEHFNIQPEWNVQSALPQVSDATLAITGDSDENMLRDAVRKAYPIMKDDAGLRNVLTRETTERGPYFDRLRKEYPVRREFYNYTLLCKHAAESLTIKARAIGFKLA